MSAFDPKRTSWPWCFFTATLSDSSKILSDVEDNGRWLRFRTAEAIRGPHKRDTPTTAKIYRPAAYAAGSTYCARNVRISPLQAVGIFAFQGFVIATLLAIIASMLIISDHPAAVGVMSICVAANVVVLLLRLFYPPWPYNIYILAVAWFAIAITLGAVVAQAVFRSGRVTYHRIIGAVLLYLLIAVAFGALYVLIGLSVPDAFKGITFEDNPALANSVSYLSFVTLTSTGSATLFPCIQLRGAYAISKA